MQFSNISIKNKLLLGNGITTILLAVLCAVFWNAINSLSSTSNMVAHTHNVMNKSYGLINSMVDQETGLRGFAVGGQDDYLEPYISGKKKFTEYLQTVKQLTSDNPTQQKRFDAVAEDARDWQNYAEQMINMRKNIRKGEKTNNELKALIATGIGKQKMDGLRAEIANGQFERIGDDILASMVNMETGLRGFMLTREEVYLEPYNSGKQHIIDTLPNIEGTTLANNAMGWINGYGEEAIRLVREANNYKRSDDLYLEFSKKQGKAYMDGLRAKVAIIVDEEKHLMDKRELAADEASSLALTVTFLGGLVVTIIAFTFSYIISNSITGPVQIAVDVARKLSKGDLTYKIEQDLITENEIGLLLEALQTTTTNLKEVITDISDASLSLGNSSEELNTTTTHTAEGSQEQLKMTDQVAVAMNEMAATVQDVAQNAGTAAVLASEANTEATTGIKVISDTVNTINKLEREIINTATRLTDFAQEAENIGGILDVIRGIADQTNLLALNAAIEAARAGEQGRGFSVVADEVRNLAQRTQESTEEIQGLIERLQKGANEAVTTMDQSRTFAESSVEEATKSGDALNSIFAVITKINDMNTQIATASEEQSVTAEHINQNVVVVNDISQKNVLNAETTVKSSKELSKLSDKLNETVSHFTV